jgi:hypothetical protein
MCHKEYAMPPHSDDDAWAVTDFAEAELGDVRRTQRLIALATVLAQRPGASLPAAGGDDAMRKAVSRFFDNAAIEPQDLLDSHVGATFPRLAPVPLVLAVQETTALDWTAHPATTGLGPLGPPAQRGRLVPTTLAFTPERVPLGILAQQGPRPAGQRQAGDPETAADCGEGKPEVARQPRGRPGGARVRRPGW